MHTTTIIIPFVSLLLIFTTAFSENLFCTKENFCRLDQSGRKIITGNNCQLISELSGGYYVHKCGDLTDIRMFVGDPLYPTAKGITINGADINSLCHVRNAGNAAPVEFYEED